MKRYIVLAALAVSLVLVSTASAAKILRQSLARGRGYATRSVARRAASNAGHLLDRDAKTA
jgi:hypothetical protein